jgi:hypothetical protein
LADKIRRHFLADTVAIDIIAKIIAIFVRSMLPVVIRRQVKITLAQREKLAPAITAAALLRTPPEEFSR